MFKDQTKLNGDAIKVQRVAFIVGDSELDSFQIFVRDRQCSLNVAERCCR